MWPLPYSEKASIESDALSLYQAKDKNRHPLLQVCLLLQTADLH